MKKSGKFSSRRHFVELQFVQWVLNFTLNPQPKVVTPEGFWLGFTKSKAMDFSRASTWKPSVSWKTLYSETPEMMMMMMMMIIIIIIIIIIINIWFYGVWHFPIPNKHCNQYLESFFFLYYLQNSLMSDLSWSYLPFPFRWNLRKHLFRQHTFCDCKHSERYPVSRIETNWGAEGGSVEESS